jgi:uncharacterized protein (TIGR03067 family)
MRLVSLPAFAVALLVAGIGSRTPAQEAKADLVKQELKRLHGAWVLVGLEQGGKKVPEAQVKAAGVKLVIEGSGYNFEADGKTSAGILRIDPATAPKRFDTQDTTFGGKGEKAVGIYHLAGDLLRVCYVPEGRQRPTEFKTQPGSDQVMQTFRRETK